MYCSGDRMKELKGMTYNEDKKRLEMDDKAFKFLLKMSKSKAKSPSGQKAAVKRFISKALKAALESYKEKHNG